MNGRKEKTGLLRDRPGLHLSCYHFATQSFVKLKNGEERKRKNTFFSNDVQSNHMTRDRFSSLFVAVLCSPNAK